MLLTIFAHSIIINDNRLSVQPLYLSSISKVRKKLRPLPALTAVVGNEKFVISVAPDCKIRLPLSDVSA